MTAAHSAIDADSWTASSFSVALPPMVAQTPQVETTAQFKELPDWTPRVHNRHVPLLAKVNRVLRATLIACCGMALLGYGLDVAATAEVSKLQEEARRLSEQNTELSAQLLRAISFQGIQSSVVGRTGLRAPEHVIIAQEVKPHAVPEYKPRKHFLPLMSGY